MVTNNPHILLIGCGKMGGAMLKAWVGTVATPNEIVVIEPSLHHQAIIEDKYQTHICASLDEVEPNFVPDIVIFAIKPQMMHEVLPLYKEVGNKNTIFVSIAAGTEMNTLEEALGHKTIIRVMPNLPAVIGQGVMVALSNQPLTNQQDSWINALLRANGQVAWITDEALMDAVTAISGSGPAYLFYFVEAFIEAAKSLGLPDELAKILATFTITGSSNLLLESEDDVSTLREQVTSKGGTTAAGLEVLMQTDEKGLKALLERTTKAAALRAKALR